jgi:hypothetical protein
MTMLILSKTILNTSHPIITLVTLSIWTGARPTETMVAAAKLMISLYMEGNR